MDEYPWMKQVAMISTLPVFQPNNVSVLLTSSMTPNDHWSQDLVGLKLNGRPLVKYITQSYLCDSCFAKGTRTVCAHRRHLVPEHIDGSDGNVVQQMMNLIAKGSYELECMGIPVCSAGSLAERLFSGRMLSRLFSDERRMLQRGGFASGLLIAVDPTPSDVSGIGVVAGALMDDGNLRQVSRTVGILHAVLLLSYNLLSEAVAYPRGPTLITFDGWSLLRT